MHSGEAAVQENLARIALVQSCKQERTRIQEVLKVRTYFHLIQIVLSITLIVVILLGSKGGGLSSVFGGEGSVYKTRRGIEKTL
ncbi:MAG TPA: preprotein translocase subunit SecG, partial [Chloroflexi bacterium]|nr:preprotein translocase subunit SecG [Chloroflexota bacterium]